MNSSSVSFFQLVTVFEAYKAQEHFCHEWFGFDRMNDNIELRQHCGAFFREVLTLTWNRWRSKLWRDQKAIAKAEREYAASKKGMRGFALREPSNAAF